MRVPGFVIWPGVTQPGTKSDLPIHAVDIFPTLAEICGIKDMPKVDGRSFVPALTGKKMEARPVFTHLPYGLPATAVMLDGWKLIRYYYDGPDQTHRYELYHLPEDPGETLNFSRSKPEVVAKLDKLIDEYAREMGAVLPKPNPEYHGALKSDFEGLPYELLEPTYKRGKTFSLIICLSGTDKVVDGNPAYADFQKKTAQLFKQPAYLLALPCLDSGHGDDGKSGAANTESLQEKKLVGLIQKVLKEHPIHPRLVYLAGAGRGAVGVWNLASRHPELFAAALPVGGRCEPAQAAALKDLPVWAFAGAQDPAVATTRSLFAALKATGSTVAKYTEYAQNEQVLLDNVWDNPEVQEWLFAQSRPLDKPGARK